MFDADYVKQTELMLRCLPAVAKQPCFALKGGGAINFFHKDMPRLSVDVDLTYCRFNDRNVSLSEIDAALKDISAGLKKSLDNVIVRPRVVEGYAIRLVVGFGDTQIKIEPNLVLRGSVQKPEELELCDAAQKRFNMSVSLPCLSGADLYGGKLCAALDRQHPRDLFDVKLLMDDTGITQEIRRAFVVYLAGHNRPMSELLAPKPQDMSEIYPNEFQGMTRVDIALAELQAVQKTLASTLVGLLDANERGFLISMKRGEPEWERLGIDNLERFPALQWKLLNIRRMGSKKRLAALKRLEEILDV